MKRGINEILAGFLSTESISTRSTYIPSGCGWKKIFTNTILYNLDFQPIPLGNVNFSGINIRQRAIQIRINLRVYKIDFSIYNLSLELGLAFKKKCRKAGSNVTFNTDAVSFNCSRFIKYTYLFVQVGVMMSALFLFTPRNIVI